jgi:mRNA-degrading endonuclease YafQ of YafQ-DinJ toxin-antitoxin module
MNIRYHKNFEKHYKKLQKADKEKVLMAISRFDKNPFNPMLKNHPLHGAAEGKRAFSAGSNLRIIFEEYENYMFVLMLDVGTHNQVY